MITLTLSSKPLGADTTPADYSDWAHFVAETINESTGLTIHVVKGGPETIENTIGQTSGAARKTIEGWLRASLLGRRDGEREVIDVLKEQGRDVVVATLKPGHVAWDEGAINAYAHHLAGVPDRHRLDYYRAYEHFARLAAERIRDWPDPVGENRTLPS